MHFALSQGTSIVAKRYVMHSTAFAKSSATLLRGLVLVAACLFLADSARADDAKSIAGFRKAIIALGPDIDPAEAELVSVTAHTTARRLQKEWQVAPFALYQNFLIHIGKRQKGFCFDWAYGIGGALKELRLKTLVLHWGASHPGTRLEHNCIVVTARGQPFREGYLIDGWRAAGRLLWWPVKKDEYSWDEDPTDTAWLQDHAPSKGSRAAQPRKTSAPGDGGAVVDTHAPAQPAAGSLE
jgi:hypothetical protein